GPVDLSAGLLAHFSFDEWPTVMNSADFGATNNAGVTGLSPGNIGTGAGDFHADVHTRTGFGGDDAFEAGESFSLALWVQAKNDDRENPIRGVIGGRNGDSFGPDNVGDGSFQIDLGSNTPTDGVWNHFTFRYNFPRTVRTLS